MTVNTVIRLLRDVSLRIKLLGIYFLGLVLIGIVGYGFFIYLEIKSYKDDHTLLTEHAQYFEQESFNHMKYSIELQHLLKRLVNSASGKRVTSETIINEFVNSVSILNNESYKFALINTRGELISTNDSTFEVLLGKAEANRKEIYNLLQEASLDGTEGRYIEMGSDSGPVGYFVNAILFDPLNYYILLISSAKKTSEKIHTIMNEKRMYILRSVVFSFVIGLTVTLLVMALLFFYLKSMTRHINSITTSIDALSQAQVSDTELKSNSNDEIGKMITSFNNYLGKKVQLEKFKQLIEEDEHINDVYCRIFTLLRSLDIRTYALYEIDKDKNKITYVNPEVCGDSCETFVSMPCSQDILVNADGCRAKRLAQTVVSENGYHVCPKFGGYAEGKNHICVPIIIGGTAGEVVHISMTPDEELNVRRNSLILKEYLKNAAPVIESKKLLANLKETSLRDPMTGLSNRRFLEEYIEVLIAECQRKKTNMGILMCDLDYFKRVNDEHGHEAGDKVLKSIAGVMKNSIRNSDIVIRYGGEEFLIIIRDAQDEQSLFNVAEKIRQNVEALEMRVSPTIALKKTISIGIAMYPADSENFWESVKYADVSLYKAKESGRNRVMRFNPDMWEHQEY